MLGRGLLDQKRRLGSTSAICTWSCGHQLVQLVTDPEDASDVQRGLHPGWLKRAQLSRVVRGKPELKAQTCDQFAQQLAGIGNLAPTGRGFGLGYGPTGGYQVINGGWGPGRTDRHGVIAQQLGWVQSPGVAASPRALNFSSGREVFSDSILKLRLKCSQRLENCTVGYAAHTGMRRAWRTQGNFLGPLKTPEGTWNGLFEGRVSWPVLDAVLSSRSGVSAAFRI